MQSGLAKHPTPGKVTRQERPTLATNAGRPPLLTPWANHMRIPQRLQIPNPNYTYTVARALTFLPLKGRCPLKRIKKTKVRNKIISSYFISCQ